MTNTQKCREAAKEIDRAAADFDSPLTTEKVAKIIERVCFPEPAKVDGYLLPCPFCKGTPEIIRVGNFTRSTQIQCEKCGCNLESNDTDSIPIENWQWNTRA